MNKNKVKILLFVIFVIIFLSTSSISSIASQIKTQDVNLSYFFNKEICNLSPSYSSDEIRSIAEFESAQELIISWPKWWSASDGYIQEPYFINLTKVAKDYITVNIVVNNIFTKNRVIKKLKENQIFLTNITFIIIYTASIWVRDYGPFFIERNGGLSIIDFHRYPKQYGFYRLIDDFFPTFYGIKYGIDYNFFTNFLLIIQGGNYMTDGQGVGFVGDRIFEMDNPHLSKEVVINRMKRFLGLEDVIVLKSGEIYIEKGGTGTGHIDMFAKILDVNTILVSKINDVNDVIYPTLEENTQILENRSYDVIRIPMLRNPAADKVIWTYTNSLIINGTNKKVVLVPQYNTPEDVIAISIYEQAMPEYDIIGIDSNTIINSFGAIHCNTLTVPIL